MPKHLVNIYIDSIFLVDFVKYISSQLQDNSIWNLLFGTCIVGTFRRLLKLVFGLKCFKILLYLCYLYPKKSRTNNSGMIGRRKQSEPWLNNFLMLPWLVYKISSHLNNLMLVWSTWLQICQNVKGSVCNFPIYETDSNFNSLFRSSNNN